MLQRSLLSALFAAAVLVTACTPKPPPAPPPEPTAEPAPPPPPPPKCEALNEQCKAAATTRATIPNSDLTFSPVVGWVYAQQSSVTMAQLSPTGASVAFMGFDTDPKDAKKEAATRDAVVGELVKQLGIAPLKRKVGWKKPDDTKALKDLKIGLWELEAGMRDKAKGSILVMEGNVAPGKGVIGVAFVPTDEAATVGPALLESFSSLGKVQ